MLLQLSLLSKYCLRLFFGLWLVLCLFKLVFILKFAANFNLNLFLETIRAGWKFDFGILLVACLLQVIVILFSKSKTAHSILFTIQLNLFTLFFLIDLFLYSSWEATFNVRALKYLSNPSEILALLSLQNILLIALAVIGISFIANQIFSFAIEGIDVNKIKMKFISIVVVLLSPLIFFILRGGFREIPINQSDAFHCKEKVYNLAALNSTWNFFSTWLFNKDFLASEFFFKVPSAVADSLVSLEFEPGCDFPIRLFNRTTNPNIILITMEGINAQLLKTYNRSHSEMPFLDSIIDSSYTFSKCFSVGFRTEQGLAAILSGSLSTPYVNLTDNINNLPYMPSLLEPMQMRGYNTQFLFGGNIEFANMKAYLGQMGFEKIMDILDFQKHERTQSLGVEDKYLFEKAYNQILENKKPYFMQIMTQSTHEPYDLDGNKGIIDEEEKYKRSAKYLDKCINEFIDKLDRVHKLENTVVIITSDHAHKYPNDYKLDTPLRFHIPFIIYSKDLKDRYKGYTDSLLFSQVNIPVTLKYIFDWSEWKPRMPYSLNHFSTSKKSAFMTFVVGYIYMNDTQYASHEYNWGNTNFTNKAIWNNHLIPLSIMQKLVDENIQTNPLVSHKGH